MDVFITIVVFILILGVIIFVHELGHLLTAKWRGVKVEEFGIGFPPRLVSFKKGETVYSLNLIPLGGFCKMVGEQDEEADAERGLQSKGYGSRILVFAAGSIMNLLLPFLLMIIAVAIPHQVGEGVKVGSVTTDSPAAVAGLQVDDVLLTANGQELVTTVDFSTILNETPDAPLVLGIEREGEQQEITVNPPYTIENGVSKAGVVLGPATFVTESITGWRAIPTGITEMGHIYAAFGSSIKQIFTGTAEIDLRGPIGIAQATGEVVQFGAYAVLVWAAMISMSIGIINLLPIPVFDGGHILFVLIEMIRGGKRISLKTRAVWQMIGLVAILAIFVIVGYGDIVRLIQGGSLFP